MATSSPLALVVDQRVCPANSESTSRDGAVGDEVLDEVLSGGCVIWDWNTHGKREAVCPGW